MTYISDVLFGASAGAMSYVVRKVYERWCMKRMAKAELKDLCEERRHSVQDVLDAALVERLKSAQGAEKILGFASEYLLDRAKDYKEIDQTMLRRIATICLAASEHINELRAGGGRWVKDEEEKAEPIHGC